MKIAVLLQPVATLAIPDFYGTFLSVSPASTQTEVEIEIKFRARMRLNSSDIVTVQLPKFTSGTGTKAKGNNIARGNVHLSPSVYFEGAWLEGDFGSITEPYSNSSLILYVKPGVWIESHDELSVRVYKTTGLRAYCGFDSAANTNDPLYVRTNATGANGLDVRFDGSDRIGSGCSQMQNCLSRGDCDYCTERCLCYERFGDGDDITRDRSVDCSLTNCAVGIAWADMPLASAPNTRSHLECSNAGLCETQRGECRCFAGFSGDACQRRVSCGDVDQGDDLCWGHGQCVTMREIASIDHALPLTETNFTYGSLAKRDSSAWDADTMQHCVCDSSWEVGLDRAETQLPEYFESDCSKRHCPSGDDPSTVRDETDCSNVTAAGSRALGKLGNKCHVECSNRGRCDYKYGRCTCYRGYTGDACEKLVTNAGAIG